MGTITAAENSHYLRGLERAQAAVDALSRCGRKVKRVRVTDGKYGTTVTLTFTPPFLAAASHVTDRGGGKIVAIHRRRQRAFIQDSGGGWHGSMKVCNRIYAWKAEDNRLRALGLRPDAGWGDEGYQVEEEIELGG